MEAGQIYNVIILDDHPLMIDGLRQLLAGNDRFDVKCGVTTIDGLLSALHEPYDILILDLNIRGGNSLELIEEIRFRQPGLRILVFSSYNTPSTVRKAFALKVDGYILKDVSQAELVEALHAVAEGKRYVGKRVADRGPWPRSGSSPAFEDQFVKKVRLTPREREVVQAILEGLESQAIADRLFISVHTVQTHRKRIFKKLGVRSAAELIKLVLHQH